MIYLRHPPSTIHHPPSTIHHPPSTIHSLGLERDGVAGIRLGNPLLRAGLRLAALVLQQLVQLFLKALQVILHAFDSPE